MEAAHIPKQFPDNIQNQLGSRGAFAPSILQVFSVSNFRAVAFLSIIHNKLSGNLEKGYVRSDFSRCVVLTSISETVGNTTSLPSVLRIASLHEAANCSFGLSASVLAT